MNFLLQAIIVSNVFCFIFWTYEILPTVRWKHVIGVYPFSPRWISRMFHCNIMNAIRLNIILSPLLFTHYILMIVFFILFGLINLIRRFRA